MRREQFADLALISLFATAALVVVLTGQAIGIAGFLVGVPMVLVLPGYAITAALVDQQVGMIERIMLSVLVSISVVILGGLLLNLLPGGLQTSSWALLLWALTTGGALIAFIRRTRVGSAIGGAPKTPLKRPWSALLSDVAWRLRVRDLILVTAALVLVLIAIGLAINGAAQQRGQGFTQLWIQQGASAQAPAVKVGVTSDELAPQQYQLRLTVDGKKYQEYQISLDPGAHWDQTIGINVSYQQGIASVDATLYRTEDSTQVYRHVHLDLVVSIRAASPTGTP
jgi:uncharacterized membrane protein